MCTFNELDKEGFVKEPKTSKSTRRQGNIEIGMEGIRDAKSIVVLAGSDADNRSHARRVRIWRQKKHSGRFIRFGQDHDEGGVAARSEGSLSDKCYDIIKRKEWSYLMTKYRKNLYF